MTGRQQPIKLELDPQNPAQFFACCGVFELAAMFSTDVVADFAYDPRQPRKASFRLANSSKKLSELLQAVKNCTVTAPEESGEAPVTLRFSDGASLTLDWWLLPDRSGKSRFKLWAGQQTTSNLAIKMKGALAVTDDATLFSSNKVPMKGPFGLDPRSTWNTLDFGYSANEQGQDTYIFPAVEMLAAIGLQCFRPKNGETRNIFSYRLWRLPISLASARAVAAGTIPTFGQTLSFAVENRSGSVFFFTFANPNQGELTCPKK